MRFPITNEGYAKRLAIIVPYRDRAQHLKEFLPHLTLYFERDKLDQLISYDLFFIEQAPGKPFNRGKLLNIGFELSKDSHDYFCFHDVDYLPLWADYSYTSRPTRLIWWGLTLREDHDRFFGAVVAVNRRDFEAVNGFSNEYWGWGPEDLELSTRFEILGISKEFRDGSFQPLPHKHAGRNEDGTFTADANRTGDLFDARKNSLAEIMQQDGLSSLRYAVREKTRVPVKRVDALKSGDFLSTFDARRQWHQAIISSASLHLP